MDWIHLTQLGSLHGAPVAVSVPSQTLEKLYAGVISYMLGVPSCAKLMPRLSKLSFSSGVGVYVRVLTWEEEGFRED
jgi:hypothetical protein